MTEGRKNEGSLVTFVPAYAKILKHNSANLTSILNGSVSGYNPERAVKLTAVIWLKN